MGQVIALKQQTKQKKKTKMLSNTPVKHRKPPKYIEATVGRAGAIAEVISKRYKLNRLEQGGLFLLINIALDDARSAGFSAGVAYGRTLRR